MYAYVNSKTICWNIQIEGQRIRRSDEVKDNVQHEQNHSSSCYIYILYLNVLPEWDEWGVLYNNTERVNSPFSSSGAHNHYIILVYTT